MPLFSPLATATTPACCSSYDLMSCSDHQPPSLCIESCVTQPSTSVIPLVNPAVPPISVCVNRLCTPSFTYMPAGPPTFARRYHRYEVLEAPQSQYPCCYKQCCASTALNQLPHHFLNGNTICALSARIHSLLPRLSCLVT